MKRIMIVGTVLLGGLWLISSGTAQAPHGTQAPTAEMQLIGSIEGPDLYMAYCASCHGPDGRGNGPMARYLKVQPSDLTRIAARNGGMFPIDRVTRIIAGEEALPSGHGTRDMPVWGPIFSHVEADRDYGRVRLDNLARYLKQLQKP